MQITAVDKRQFAFGLRWSDVPSKDKAGELARTANGGSPALYTSIPKAAERGRYALGWADVAEVTQRGRLYSYAEALARRGASGVYCAALAADDKGAGKLWYVAIADKSVVPDTDVIVDMDTGLMAVTSLKGMFDLPVYFMGDPASVGLTGVGSFELECVRGVKLSPLKQTGSSGGAVLILLAVVALAGVAVWALWPSGGSDGDVAEDPGMAAQQAREMYVGAVHTEIDVLPASSGWVVDAFDAARAAFSPALGGWRLNGYTCTPSACIGNYTSGRGAARSAGVLTQQFGKHVRLLPDLESAEVTLTLQPNLMQWSDDQILAPISAYPPLAETIGRIPMTFQADMDGPAVSDDLAAKNSAPPDASPLLLEGFTLRRAAALEAPAIGAMAHHFGQDGFVVTELVVSSGVADVPPAWRITFRRVAAGRPQ